ncbi:hypothetical protein CEXT_685851 [Caerostris extrusa]|uniref:Uncharacterized protein n=1 Tax=Caerostris extrusa TaxID=172846 RepID=A0AAV4Q781_CAEEX|nr:hypothetical protein CEXT_685851 [Caerostris extrusa]
MIFIIHFITIAMALPNGHYNSEFYTGLYNSDVSSNGWYFYKLIYNIHHYNSSRVNIIPTHSVMAITILANSTLAIIKIFYNTPTNPIFSKVDKSEEFCNGYYNSGAFHNDHYL